MAVPYLRSVLGMQFFVIRFVGFLILEICVEGCPVDVQAAVPSSLRGCGMLGIWMKDFTRSRHTLRMIGRQ